MQNSLKTLRQTGNLPTKPYKTARALSYKSSHKSVATVDANGTVTMHSLGETTITATVQNGEKPYRRSMYSMYNTNLKMRLN